MIKRQIWGYVIFRQIHISLLDIATDWSRQGNPILSHWETSLRQARTFYLRVARVFIFPIGESASNYVLCHAMSVTLRRNSWWCCPHTTRKKVKKQVLLASSLSKPDVEGMKALLRVPAGSLPRLGKAKSHAIDLGISIYIDDVKHC